MVLRNSLAGVAVLVSVALALAARSAPAEDKKDAKSIPAGVWAKKDAELKIEFADKGVLKISPHGKDEFILILCKYTIEKDGLIKVKITDLEGEAKEKVKEKLPVGLTFSFKWKAKKDAATLEDVTGENTEVFKSHMEGEFEKK